MGFKIIGIRVLSGCSPKIRKVLKEDESYFLCDGYKASQDGLSVIKTTSEPLPESIERLYDVKGAGDHSVHVTVSAIVGKNGDGKSTLIEVVLRIINNFAYCFGFLHDQGSIKLIIGLKAILHYEVDGVLYSIRCLNGETSWYENNQRIELGASTDFAKKKVLKEIHAEKLFYSLIINYSLYAYNSMLLRQENDGDGCWVDELFHKNDSYQTPIVLNPMRDEGNIDVNKEEYLSKQRLISIFTTVNKTLSAEEKRESRSISDTEVAIGYAFKLEEEAKLTTKTIAEHFVSQKNTYYEWEELKGATERREPVNENIIGGIQGFLMDFFVSRRGTIIPDNLLSLAKEKNNRHPQELTDLSRIINAVIHTFSLDKSLKGRFDYSLFNRFKNWNRPKMNYAQFYRLLLIVAVWKELTKDNRFYMQGARLDEVLKQRHINPKAAAMLYVLYKVVSIRINYPSIAQNIPLKDEKYNVLTNAWPNAEIEKAVKSDVDAICNTRDYRTLKLYQTLNYLKREDDDWYCATTSMPQGIEGYNHFIDFDKLKKAIKSNKPKEAMEYLPSPIFYGDIVLKNDEDCYTMSTLSSGMTQRLNSVGSFVYHLRNLDDSQKAKNLIDYQNILVIFEEVELYFHPEYQKSYLKYLLKQIERSYLQRIKNIHIIYVTHSPFILSDVLKENMLCLTDGRMDDKKGFDTFGANIHNLLRNPFFMRSGTIGDYAQMTINRIIAALKIYEWLTRNNDANLRYLNQTEIKDSLKHLNYVSLDPELFFKEFPKESLFELISMIDEPLIRHSLTEMWNKQFCSKSEIEKRIEYLESELKRLKGTTNTEER